MNNKTVSIESKIDRDDKKTDFRKRERKADTALRRISGKVVSIQDFQEDEWDDLLDDVD